MLSFHVPAEDLRRGRVADRPAMTGAVAALAVFALHLLFGLAIALSPPLRGPIGASKPLVLLTELPPPLTGASTGTIALLGASIPLSLSLSLPPPRPSLPVLPSSTDTDGVIIDAAQADATQVGRVCGAWAMQRWRRGEARQEPSVLVRVGEDGQVSETRMLIGTGSADSDAALQHCLMKAARLTPLRLEGHAVAAWQRLRPLATLGAASSRRP